MADAERRAGSLSALAGEVMASLVGLVDELLTIDLNLTERPGALSLAAMSAPKILDVVSRADALLEDVGAVYEVTARLAGAGGRGTEDEDSSIPGQDISDLAFLSRGEIRQCRRRLEGAIAAGDALKVVATAGEALRRVTSALLPLESAVGNLEGIEAPARVSWDLEISLMVRKLYARLYRELAIDQEPGRDELAGRLGAFLTCGNELRSSEVYRYLRFEDRIQMTALIKRVASWLATGQESDPTLGRRLWDELANLVELLRLVSNRSELREHDRQVVARTCQELYNGSAPAPPTGPMPAHLLEELDNLLGLDVDLDALLRDGRDRAPSAWEACLRRLAANLRAAVDGDS